MASYEFSKGMIGSNQEGEVESDWTRLEPLLTPELLTHKYLFGIPLVSATADPVSGARAKMSDYLLKELIEDAVAELELEIGIRIFATRMRERLPYDNNEYRSYGFFKLSKRPVASIESLRVESTDGLNFFDIPLEWIETGNIHLGQINIVPMSIGQVNSNSTLPYPGLGFTFLQVGRGENWLPAYWTCEYTTGWVDGALPRIINSLIGLQTALNVLSLLAATNAQRTSTSLGIDGMSQSIGTPGPNIFAKRIEELEGKRQALVKKIKKRYSSGFIVGSL